MENVKDFMNRMHRQLGNNYRSLDGKYSESCLLVAAELAKRLFKEGTRASICFVSGPPLDKFNKGSIFPKRYARRVEWAAHVFAVAGERVFDPMVSAEPVPREDYRALAFDECSEIKTYIPSDRIEEFLARN